ncbi:MAG: hypothetical protein K2Q14_03620, partial [Gammaproteobacteria bacterium]|nr:hypothetical protein [Gammaproteobacteria bacterium]
IALRQSTHDLLNQTPSAEKATLLALDAAALVCRQFDDVKGFDNVDQSLSIDALNYKIDLVKVRKDKLSINFKNQDGPHRTLKIAGFIKDLKQAKNIIDKNLNALNVLVDSAEKKQTALVQAWAIYEAGQKTILPHLKKQKKQQKAAVAIALAALVEQKKSLLIQLTKQCGVINLDIIRLEETRLEEGYAPIKTCNAFIAVFQAKLDALMCHKQQMVAALVEQKNTFSAGWTAVAKEAESAHQDEQQLISLLPMLEETINISIQTLMQAKDRLVLRKSEADEKVAKIRAYDNDAEFNERPINQAICALDEEIDALKHKKQHIHNSGISYQQAITAKKDLKKALVTAHEHLEAQPVPTLRCAEGTFNHYQQQMNDFNDNVNEANIAKQAAIAKLQHEMSDYTRTSMSMFSNGLPTDGYDDWEKNASAAGAIQFFEAVTQKINHNQGLQLTHIDTILINIEHDLTFCEQKALPKKRAQLTARIDDTLNADIAPIPQDINEQPIRRTFTLYQQCLTETRREILSSPDFALGDDEKEGYLNRLRDIHQSLQSSLKTELGELESEAITAHKNFVTALKPLNASFAPPDAQTPCPHRAKGWVGETRFFIPPTKEQTAEIECKVNKLTQGYITQKTAIAERRAALYTTSQHSLNTAITAINVVSQKAKKKIAENQYSAMAFMRQGVFYTATTLAITSPVCLGIFEGLVAGFITGLATGVVGLPFWLVAGALMGGAIGVSLSVGSTFFAHKAKQVAQNGITCQRVEKESALERDFKDSKFNLSPRN